MPPLTCHLFVQSNLAHLQQVYTGFHRLHRRGVIRLSQTLIAPTTNDPARPPHLRDAWRAHLQVVVNDRLKLFYDVHDSFEIDELALARSDAYFKRSYAPHFARTPAYRGKVFPLGLNYHVFDDAADPFDLQRMALEDSWSERLVTALRYTGLDRWLPLVYLPRVSNTQGHPDYTAEPRALFMTRAYAPEAAPSPEKAAERERLNAMRANCIRALRAAFGARFYGGFEVEPYAQTHYPDCLIPAEHMARKRRYLRLLADFPIGVTTRGLHDSNGWKLAEYVACARAIVTERLAYQPPGPFACGSNYLEFTSPEECVAAVAQLFDQPALRHQLMTNNYRYYHAYLKPEALVLNSLATALSL
jgi:hypothetical protein